MLVVEEKDRITAHAASRHGFCVVAGSNLAVGMLRLEAGLCAQNGVCTQLVVNMLGAWVWHLSGTKAAFAQNGICTQLVVNMLGCEKARSSCS